MHSLFYHPPPIAVNYISASCLYFVPGQIKSVNVFANCNLADGYIHYVNMYIFFLWTPSSKSESKTRQIVYYKHYIVSSC